MVQFNRAIDRGDGLEIGVPAGFKAVLAGTGIIRPENNAFYGTMKTQIKFYGETFDCY